MRGWSVTQQLLTCGTTRVVERQRHKQRAPEWHRGRRLLCAGNAVTCDSSLNGHASYASPAPSPGADNSTWALDALSAWFRAICGGSRLGHGSMVMCWDGHAPEPRIEQCTTCCIPCNTRLAARHGCLAAASRTHRLAHRCCYHPVRLQLLGRCGVCGRTGVVAQVRGHGLILAAIFASRNWCTTGGRDSTCSTG